MPTLAELLGLSARPVTPDESVLSWTSGSPDSDLTAPYLAGSDAIGPSTSSLGPESSGSGPGLSPDYSSPLLLGVPTSGRFTTAGLAMASQRSGGGILGPIMAEAGPTTAPAGGIFQNLFGDSALNRPWVTAPSAGLVDTQTLASVGSSLLPITDPTINGLSPGFFPPRPYAPFAGPAANAWPTAQRSTEVTRPTQSTGQQDTLPIAGGFGATPTRQPVDYFLVSFPSLSGGTSLEQGAAQDQENGRSPVSVRIHRAAGSDWPASDINAMEGQDSSPFDRPEKDWSTYLQKAHYIDQSAITGHPLIDRTTKFLIETLEESANTMGHGVPSGMRANVFGIAIHTDFGTRVRQLDLPGIGQKGVEQSWSLDGLARYGLAGSIRTDVYLKDRFGRVLAIYDVKTGNAQLTAQRVKELRDAVGAGGDVPVIELSYRDLTALQR